MPDNNEVRLAEPETDLPRPDPAIERAVADAEALARENTAAQEAAYAEAQHPVTTAAIDPAAGQSSESAFYRVLEQITLNDAYKSRRRGLRERKCVAMWVSCLPSRSWWADEFGVNFKPEIERAEVMTVGQVITNFGASPNVILDLLDEELLAKAPPRRRCEIRDRIGAHVIAMLRTAPTNPMVRSLVQAALRVPPPADAVTFDALKDWIEFNFPRVGGAVKPATVVTTATQAEQHDRPIRIRYTERGTEEGTCRYTVPVTKYCSCSVTNDDLLDAVDNADNEDDLVDLVADLCLENGQTDDSEHSYDEMETSNLDGDDYTPNSDAHNFTDDIRRLIRERLRRLNLTPEQRERIGLTED